MNKTFKKMNMKKLNLFTLLFIIVAFAACKKENSSTNLNNLSYSPNSTTKEKTDLENTGIAMVSQMSDLNNQPGMQATVNLLYLAAQYSGALSSEPSPAFGTLKAVAALGNGKGNVEGIFSRLRQTSDDIDLVELYDSIAGTYTYDFNTGGFDKTASSTFSVKFPATLTDKNDSLNTGVFEIAKPTVQTGPFTFGSSTISELPTYIQYDIKVNGVTALNYTFTGAYNSDGMPTSVTSTLTIGTFVFATSWSYSTASVSLNYSITDSSTTILGIGWTMTGNFDKTNIQNFSNSQNPDPTTILTNSNAYFQFYNIKIAGQIDFKDFYNGMISLEKESTDSVPQSQVITLINNNIALVVVYANTNQMIAKADPYYNSTGELSIRLVFADKSKVDLSTYFQSGFDKLTGDFNTFLSELQSTYGISNSK
jgi:hypothetical protein